ncbi:MAG: hypothetical protein AAB352_02680 [Patescibacteria group bacterium]
MVKKKIILILIIIIIVVLIYPVYKFIQIRQIQAYKSRVDNSLYEKLVEINKNKEQFQKDILFRPEILGQPVKELTWGDAKVRLNDEIVEAKDSEGYDTKILYEIIQVEISNSGWQNLIRKEASSFCDAGVIRNEKLLCVGSHYENIVLNIIDKNGQYTTKTLVSTWNNIDKSFFLDKQNLYFVFTDNRLVWSLPIPDDAPHNMGTQLLMAGELDIETLNFKETVIGYADVKYYDGYSDTILLPDIKQWDGVRRIEESGAFVKD